eukprot:TRINITY_DN526_c0_g1_i2.p1 TRINITY_DN526_c0_g1~~TRINITY_DN526_c0_g1_i2.p1  ORF type:complete len:137 (-),score=28.40 TRINITY_DN526_c0_g1_i2:195-605(-)
MSSTTFSLLCLLCFFALVSGEGTLVPLGHGEIESKTKEGIWLVEFHKGGSSAQFTELANLFEDTPGVHFATHDCDDEHKSHAQDHIITKWPSLRLRRHGLIYHFTDDYEVPQMKKFVQAYKEAFEAEEKRKRKDEL